MTSPSVSVSKDSGLPRRVKENRSTETKIHLILHPLDPLEIATVQKPNSPLLGKRSRVDTPAPPPQEPSPSIPDEDEEMDDLEDQEDNAEGAEASDEEEDEEGLSSDEELKAAKNKKMTQRQRAMATGEEQPGLFALAMESERKPMTEHEKNRKSEASRRRKRQAERQIEEQKVGGSI